MLNDATCFNRIYIVCGFSDLKFGIDTLVSIIDAKTTNSPYVTDTLYLFCGRRADRIFGAANPVEEPMERLRKKQGESWVLRSHTVSTF